MKKTTRIAALLAAAALIFGNLFCSCSIDTEFYDTPNPDPVVENVDIAGVWSYTQGRAASYLYAENGTFYAAAERGGSYYYSKATAILGTYTVRGNTVTMDAGGEEYTCTVSGDSFTLNMGKIMLTKVPGAKAACTAIDADIAGVWNGTIGEYTFCVYAENGTFYTAAESDGKYVYSRAKKAVWGTYTATGNTVTMTVTRLGKFSCTVKDNMLTSNAGEIIEITLIKVEGAEATCIDVDIAGVWSYTQGGAASYAYADETTVYEAVKVGNNYYYSKAKKAVFGTYTIIGNTAIMDVGGEEYTCTVSGDSFTLNMGESIGEITLTKVKGAVAACTAIDADIAGVWNGTISKYTICVYAENGILYIPGKYDGRYVYSEKTVLGTYTAIGNTVTMTLTALSGRKVSCTVKDNMLTSNAGEIIEITLTKVEGAEAIYVSGV